MLGTSDQARGKSGVLANNSIFLLLHTYYVPGRGRSPHTNWRSHCNQQTFHDEPQHMGRKNEAQRGSLTHSKPPVGSSSSITHHVHWAAQLWAVKRGGTRPVLRDRGSTLPALHQCQLLLLRKLTPNLEDSRKDFHMPCQGHTQEPGASKCWSKAKWPAVPFNN